ncbi:MAG: Pr6Pr family membrane protein [bacterium]
MSVNRMLALLIAMVALVSIVVQFTLNARVPGLETWLPRLLDMTRAFTYLTTALIVLHMTAVWLDWPVARNLSAALTLAVVLVGTVYWALLAPATPIQGLAWYPNIGMHLLVPVLTALWWLRFAPKDLRLRDVFLWLIWPLVYCIYALIRGQITGIYPYFFIDVGQFGWLIVIRNILGLVVAFGLAGLVQWAAGRLAQRVLARRVG